METATNLSTSDRLRSLTNDGLFWFLRNRDLGHIQHGLTFEKYDFGSAHIETLASGAVGKLNEDAPMVLPMGKGRTLFAVLDGASSQKQISGLHPSGLSGAFYLSHLASMGFGTTAEYANLTQKAELTAKDIMVTMNEWIHEKLRNVPGIDYSDISTLSGMAAAFMLVDIPNKRLTIAQVADTSIALARNDGEVKIITPNLNERFDEETLKYAIELVGKYKSDLAHIRQIPEAKELIASQIMQANVNKTNKRGGCGIMNGMPEMVSNGLICSDTMPINDEIVSMVLFSDGAILPFTGKDISLETSAEALIDTLERNDNSSALTIGASILEHDVDFTKIPRLKLKDDATVINVSFRL